tara:strand:- start:5413 stop:6030 length:618 start_codon:yes stop_codon:yes gene_type:complete
MDAENISSILDDWMDDGTAPTPIKRTSRSYYLYEIIRSLGGTATLNEMYKMIPASDMAKPKNKQQLRDWISSSATSKGYIVRLAKDKYRVATLEEYDAVVVRNKRAHKVHKNKIEAKKRREEKKQAMPTVQKEITLEPPVQGDLLRGKAKKEAKEELAVERKDVSSPSSVPLPTPNTPFVNQYLGSLIGTSVAIVLFYLVTKLLG